MLLVEANNVGSSALCISTGNHQYLYPSIDKNKVIAGGDDRAQFFYSQRSKDPKYALDSIGCGFIVLLPGCQFAGQTSLGLA